MLKKIILVLLSFNLLTSNIVVANNSSKNEMSSVEYAIWWTVGIGTTAVIIVYAPIAVPLVIANAKAAAVVVGAKAAAAGTAIKTGVAVAAPVAKAIAPVIASTNFIVTVANSVPDIELRMATAGESSRYSQAKEDFEKCLNKHAYPNRLIIPEACKEKELLFALLAQANIQPN